MKNELLINVGGSFLLLRFLKEMFEDTSTRKKTDIQTISLL